MSYSEAQNEMNNWEETDESIEPNGHEEILHFSFEGPEQKFFVLNASDPKFRDNSIHMFSFILIGPPVLVVHPNWTAQAAQAQKLQKIYLR